MYVISCLEKRISQRRKQCQYEAWIDSDDKCSEEHRYASSGQHSRKNTCVIDQKECEDSRPHCKKTFSGERKSHNSFYSADKDRQYSTYYIWDEKEEQSCQIRDCEQLMTFERKSVVKIKFLFFMHELKPAYSDCESENSDQYDEKSGIISVNESGKCIRELF